jgi:nucleoside-diphosphate-sugar epimerase
MKKKVLLLGGAGFIGMNIAKYLGEQRDYDITIADNFFRGGGKIDEELAALVERFNLKIIEGDFTDPSVFDRLEQDYDYVYMLASVVGVDYVNKMPDQIIRINTALIYNTLEWLRRSKCGKLLFTSTSECYAGTIESFGYAIPTPEDIPLTIQDIGHPRFTYAVTKMLGESGFLNYSKILGFECTIIRYHNVFGPRMGFKHVIPHLAQRFTNKENPFKIYGFDQTRSFNYIDDAVQGTVLAMEKGGNGEIYHIGANDEITIEELVRYTGELMGFDGTYEYAPTYPGSVNRRCPDISKSKRELGYEPQFSWKQGLEKTMAWYSQYLNSGKELHESFYDNKEKAKA